MIAIDQSRCVGCGKCIKECVFELIELVDGKAAAKNGSCMACGHCEAVCPAGAVKVAGIDDENDPEPLRPEWKLDPQNVLGAIRMRRSIRDYKKGPIAEEKIRMLIEAVRYSETAVNRQNVRLIFIQEKLEQFKPMVWDGWLRQAEAMAQTDPAQAASIREFYRRWREDPSRDRLFFNAPAMLLICAKDVTDGGIACGNVEMMAVAQGLGVLFDGLARRAIEASPDAVEFLGLTDEMPIIGCLLIGEPNVEFKRTVRRRQTDVVRL